MSKRRNFLRKVGIFTGAAIAGAGTIGTAAASNSTSKLNTDFNPQNKKELKQFIRKLRTLPRKKRFALSDELSRAQQKAIFEGLKPAKLEAQSVSSPAMGGKQSEGRTVHQKKGSNSEAQASQTDPTASDQYVVKAYSTLGFLLWKFHHDIIWDYDYSSVYNITSNAYPSNVDPTWRYDGISSQYVRNEGTYFDAFKQGEFHFCAVAGYFCGYYTYPYIEWKGYDDGTDTIVQASCDC